MTQFLVRGEGIKQLESGFQCERVVVTGARKVRQDGLLFSLFKKLQLE